MLIVNLPASQKRKVTIKSIGEPMASDIGFCPVYSVWKVVTYLVLSGEKVTLKILYLLFLAGRDMIFKPLSLTY